MRLVLPAPVEGQLLWVANDDDDPVRIGDVLVPGGSATSLLYAGGRFRVLGPAPLPAPPPPSE